MEIVRRQLIGLCDERVGEPHIPYWYTHCENSCVYTSDKIHSFDILNATDNDDYWKSKAVPSRLSTPKTHARPLAGVRISVKDIYKLSSTKSSLNVRSFLDTYGPETETSVYVKKFIDLGAVIVGRTKMAAFTGSEKAPEYWIDFLCPFNPRADG